MGKVLTPPKEILNWSNQDGIPVTLTAFQTPEQGHGWGFIASTSEPKDCQQPQISSDTVPNSIVLSVSSGFYTTR